MANDNSPIISTAHFSIGQKSDIGRARDTNQDSLSVFVSTSASSENRPDFGLFIVADGMGGHIDGAKAAATTTRMVSKAILERVLLPYLSDPNSNAYLHQSPLAETLTEAIQHTNGYIHKNVPGSGTTITAVTIIGEMVYVAHAGDSRAYLIQPNRIEQLTRDHSMVQRLIELGQFTAEEAATRDVQNALYRAIGLDDALEVEIAIRVLAQGDILLLCSDGLWNTTKDDELQSIVLEYSSNMQAACEALVALANERGGLDNITVILVKLM